MKNINIAVVGAGISGISTANELKKYGYKVDIFEAQKDVGGRVSLSSFDLERIIIGGENIGNGYSTFKNLCSDYGINNFEKYNLSIEAIGREKKITINKEKKIKTIINLLSIMSLKDILKIRKMILAIKKFPENSFLGGSYFKKYNNEVISSVFSKKYIDYILRNLVLINNAAEADEIYMNTFGTNLSMLLDEYKHIKDEEKHIFEVFDQKPFVHKKAKVISLWYENNILQGIILEGNHKYKYDGVVISTTALDASKILSKTNEKLSVQLNRIRYFPMAMIIAKYEKNYFPKNINSYTFPKDSLLSNVGVYSSKKRNYLRYTIAGRKGRDILKHTSDIVSLLNDSEKELYKYLSIIIDNRIDFTGRVTRQIAYAPNHQEVLDQINLLIEDNKGLYLAGDYIYGASLEGCSRSGVRAAKNIQNYIKNN